MPLVHALVAQQVEIALDLRHARVDLRGIVHVDGPVAILGHEPPHRRPPRLAPQAAGALSQATGAPTVLRRKRGIAAIGMILRQRPLEIRHGRKQLVLHAHPRAAHQRAAVVPGQRTVGKRQLQHRPPHRPPSGRPQGPAHAAHQPMAATHVQSQQPGNHHQRKSGRQPTDQHRQPAGLAEYRPQDDKHILAHDVPLSSAARCETCQHRHRPSSHP